MTEAPGSALVVELASDTQIRMTRMLNAPRALVFETLTKPEHIRRWWGPRSMAMVSWRPVRVSSRQGWRPLPAMPRLRLSGLNAMR